MFILPWAWCTQVLEGQLSTEIVENSLGSELAGELVSTDNAI